MSRRRPSSTLYAQRSSARTGGPAVRLPSVLYWPPWHGQPKPAGSTGVYVTFRRPARYVRCLSGVVGPFACTGQPRWTQRLERIVKLGSPSSRPLKRTYAVRSATSPSSGFMLNCVISHSPSLKVSSGPRSTSMSMKPSPFLKGGRPAKTSGGIVTRAPIAAPRPNVMAERKVLRLASCSPIDARAICSPAAGAAAAAGSRPALARHVVDPGDPEQDHDDGADGHDPPAHEQADERERDSNGHADRPEAEGLVVTLGNVLGLIHRSPGLRVAYASIQSLRISPVNVVADASKPYSRQRRSTSSLTSADISISSGHGRASSSGSLCVASMPSLPP